MRSAFGSNSELGDHARIPRERLREEVLNNSAFQRLRERHGENAVRSSRVCTPRHFHPTITPDEIRKRLNCRIKIRREPVLGARTSTRHHTVPH
jgi:hypothetical protein